MNNTILLYGKLRSGWRFVIHEVKTAVLLSRENYAKCGVTSTSARDSHHETANFISHTRRHSRDHHVHFDGNKIADKSNRDANTAIIAIITIDVSARENTSTSTKPLTCDQSYCSAGLLSLKSLTTRPSAGNGYASRVNFRRKDRKNDGDLCL